MANFLTKAWRALTPGRETVTAALAGGSGGGYEAGSIVIPEARDRALEIFDRVQRPQDVASTLEEALTGDLWRQQMLFQAMIDTWPRLQKALREVKLAARKAPWTVEPYCQRGDKPDAAAEKRAKEIERMIWGMKPDPVRGMKGFEGTVEELAMGYFLGHHVLETHWERRGGEMVPRATLQVPPRYFGYPIHMDGEPDRLMLDPEGGRMGSGAMVDFPPHRFLIAVNGGHSGHPAQAAPLRVLTGYWLSAIFGLKWFMQYAQLFGIPFRWATYAAGNTGDKATIAAMMQNIGAQGWGAFPAGTELKFLESSKGGSSLAQKALLDLADEQCDIFILGQTLTSSAGDKGSQALGTVHMEVRGDIIEGICDFVGEILSHQLVPAIAAANGGEIEDLPSIWAKFEKPRDEKGMAERDAALGLLDGKMAVAKSWLYERHNVPMPAAGDELFKDEPEPVVPPPGGGIGPDGKPIDPENPLPGKPVIPPGGEKVDPQKKTLKVEAADVRALAVKVGTLIAAKDEPAADLGRRVRALIAAGGFRTLEDGRVIYIHETSSRSPGDATADAYRSGDRSRREAGDRAADREAKQPKDQEPSAAELADPPPDDADELAAARKEYEAEMLAESMADFPEIGATLRGKLPRPDMLPADEPLKGEVKRIWDRFAKETARRKKNGQKVIKADGADDFFAAKGERIELDTLRQQMNAKGFDFATPGQMLEAVFESLEGRKSWGTTSSGYGIAAARADDPPEVAALLAKMTAAVEKGAIVDEQVMADLLGAAWIRSAAGKKPVAP